MRRLMLLRHAKSDRSPGVRDLDRPLNPRGRHAAPQMGAYLRTQGLLPDHVVVSPSARTRETWELLRAPLDRDGAEFVDAIYEAPIRALLKVVRAAPRDARSLLMIGHNPGLQDLALNLVGTGPSGARGRLSVEYPTASLAVIDFDAEAWSAIEAGTGHLERFVTPKALDAEAAA